MIREAAAQARVPQPTTATLRFFISHLGFTRAELSAATGWAEAVIDELCATKGIGKGQSAIHAYIESHDHASDCLRGRLGIPSSEWPWSYRRRRPEIRSLVAVAISRGTFDWDQVPDIVDALQLEVDRLQRMEAARLIRRASQIEGEALSHRMSSSA